MFDRLRGRSLLWFIAVLLFAGSSARLSSAQQSAASSFEDLAKSATTAREAGKKEDSIRDYQHAVAMRADWEEGWWYLGTMQYDSDHFAEAIPALQKVVQIDPALGPAWNFLGLCEFETRDYGNALKHLEKGQQLGTGDDPEIARVSRYHLALLLIRSGAFEKASSMIAAAFADQPPAQVKVALGLLLLRAPLLPQEVDPSQDALVQAAGETASLLARKDSVQTIDSFRSLVKKYPNTPYLHYAFGIALASAALNEEALRQQQEELKISPESALPYIEVSSLQRQLHRPQEALRAAEKAVRLAPNSSAAHHALAQALQAAGQKEKAAEEFRAAKALVPEKPLREMRIVQMYAHDDSAPAATVNAAVDASKAPAASFDEVSRQAAASLAAGNSDEAIRIYQQALRQHPEWDEGQWNLATISYSSGHYPEAITALKACVAHRPGYGTAWAMLGLSEFEIKDYNNALIHLQRGQDLGLSGSPESVKLARYRLAILLNRDSEFDRAAELLAPEAGPGPLVKEIQFALGLTLLRVPLLPEQVEASKNSLVLAAGEIAGLLQASKYDEAFPKFQELLRQYPATPFLHYAYATGLAAMSQYDEAEAQLREELKISPASGIAYVRLASVALKQRRPADALPAAQQAVQLTPDSAEGHYLLGRSYLELGQEEKAVQELEAARKLAPGSPEVHFNLAKAYARVNRPEKADEERAAFARLNALAEQQRSHRGNQSYSGSHDKTDFSIQRAEPPATATEEPH
jgi:tetratricopeptide (TPR) repeat protein